MGIRLGASMCHRGSLRLPKNKEDTCKLTTSDLEELPLW
nr:MAG TPA: growth factor-like protein [Caudoviricetes sp.]